MKKSTFFGVVSGMAAAAIGNLVFPTDWIGMGILTLLIIVILVSIYGFLCKND